MGCRKERPESPAKRLALDLGGLGVKKKIVGAPFEEWGSDFVLDAQAEPQSLLQGCGGCSFPRTPATGEGRSEEDSVLLVLILILTLTW